MGEQPTALDVFEGVLYFAREFSFDEEYLHTAFFKLKREYPEL